MEIMTIPVEEKKAEAVSRMNMLGIFGQTIRQFEHGNKISISEPPYGAFYWAEDEDLAKIREFEEDNAALVYMVIRSYTEFGVLDSYLYVSDYKDDWPMDRDDLEGGSCCAYVYNRSDPFCSEIGSIGIQKTIAGGLVRTW